MSIHAILLDVVFLAAAVVAAIGAAMFVGVCLAIVYVETAVALGWGDPL